MWSRAHVTWPWLKFPKAIFSAGTIPFSRFQPFSLPMLLNYYTTPSIFLLLVVMLVFRERLYKMLSPLSRGAVSSFSFVSRQAAIWILGEVLFRLSSHLDTHKSSKFLLCSRSAFAKMCAQSFRGTGHGLEPSYLWAHREPSRLSPYEDNRGQVLFENTFPRS
jgi:hypothetical protein